MAVRRVKGRAELRALVMGSMGPRFLARGASNVTGGLEGPAHTPAPNEPWCSDGPVWRPGGRVSLALGLQGPQSPALWHQTPWEGTLRGQTIVRVNPQEAGLWEWRAVWGAEGWDEVKALGRGSVGPRVLERGAFKGGWGLGGPCPFSSPE